MRQIRRKFKTQKLENEATRVKWDLAGVFSLKLKRNALLIWFVIIYYLRALLVPKQEYGGRDRREPKSLGDLAAQK
jgi:hypothetical protein